MALLAEQLDAIDQALGFVSLYIPGHIISPALCGKLFVLRHCLCFRKTRMIACKRIAGRFPVNEDFFVHDKIIRFIEDANAHRILVGFTPAVEKR